MGLAAAARASLGCLSAVALLLPPPAVAALDVTDTWKVSVNGDESFVDFAQSGTSLQATIFSTTLTGIIDGGGSFHLSAFLPTCELALFGRVVGETRLVGTLAGLCPGVQQNPIAGIRCECDDGNATDGDGCDARCQVEPCFTCSGAPSTCVPSADGSSCDDRHACTSNETCAAGVCGGGSPVSPCIDLSGAWVETTSIPDLELQESVIVDVRQVGAILELGGTPTSVSMVVGTIDPVTGAMEKGTGVGALLCPAAAVSTGTAALDGNGYALTGTRYTLRPFDCPSVATSITATRCVGPCVLPTTTTTSTTTTTTMPLLLSTKRLLLKDHVEAARRGLTLGSKDDGLIIGANGSSGDPTLHGATLRVRTAAGCAGACDATYELPAAGWQLIGKPGAGEGYRYADRLLLAGPVKKAKVKPGKELTVVAGGAQLAHELSSDPSPVDLVLTLGTHRACFRSGGKTELEAGRKFKAIDAPAPGACP